jgi:molecular chaperone GrpE
MTDRDPESHGAPAPAGDPPFGAGPPADAAAGGTAGPVDAPDDAPLDAPADDLADGSAGSSGDSDDESLDPPGGDLVEDLADEFASGSPEVEQIMVLTQQRDDYRDALIRLQADFENYKKRMIKQQTDHLERAAAALVDKLLPVLDTADLALAHGGGEDVKQLTSALTSVLEREGLERIDPDGGPFDPTLHDAVAHEPSDDGRQEVAEVMRAGYRWKGRVLRPAMVKVRG